jgi:glutathione synthase/RimK-type ligase-like ATP-grasp enzyme
MREKKILLIGGNKDFNITRMAYFLRERNIPSDIVRLQIGNPVDITLDFSDFELRINGKPSNHSAVFFRQDGFESALNNNDKVLWEDSDNIFNVLRQYLILREDIKVFGRKQLGSKGKKIVNLYMAKELGFKIPNTVISSNIIDLTTFAEKQTCIQKPIDSGSYTILCDTEKLKLRRDDFPRPYLIQECLKQPEIRIYCVGEKIFPFQIAYEGIDYRKLNGNEIKVTPIEIDSVIADKYIALSKKLGIEYSAGDFMTDENGDLVFLEINNAPMFARADETMNGEICQAMVDFLLA